ncbi:MAG: hypothetical protein ACKV2O_23520 [Acidimicrobiales bacterium]
MQCEELAEVLSAVADGSERLSEGQRWHVEHCLRCQAEVVQYRKLLRALRAIRTEVLEPAPGLLNDILVAIAQSGERNAVRHLLSGRKVVYVGGIAAATAGAAGAVVLATMSRRSRLRLAS